MKIRIQYQKAWTIINWYDDFELFITEYRNLKTLINKDSSIHEIELLINLLLILRTAELHAGLKPEQCSYNTEYEYVVSLLDHIKSQAAQACSALIARTQLVCLHLFHDPMDQANAQKQLSDLLAILEESRQYIEYPFDKMHNLIDEFGSLFHESSLFDKITDKIAELCQTHASDISSAEIYIKRAIQKIEKELFGDGIVYFGKAALKLAKHDTAVQMRMAQTGLGICYQETRLHWAAHASYIAALAISLKHWRESGFPDSSIVDCLRNLIQNELMIGRIPNLLCWIEFYRAMVNQFQTDKLQENLEFLYLIDGILTCRLTNTVFERIAKQGILPDILGELHLDVSKDCLLFLLGHEVSSEMQASVNDIEDFLNRASKQPFVDQIAYNTEFVDEEIFRMTSNLLGAEVQVIGPTKLNLVIFSEFLLAFLEGFLATSLKSIFPQSNSIKIIIEESVDESPLATVIDPSDNLSIKLLVNTSIFNKADSQTKWSELISFLLKVLRDRFIILDIENHFKALLEDEEVSDRIALQFHHHTFTSNSLGTHPKYLLADWCAGKPFRKYDLKRTDTPIAPHTEKSSRPSTSNWHSHTKKKVFNNIDEKLWAKARWCGFGLVVIPPDNLGLMLAFQDEPAAISIFQNWIDKFGYSDTNEELRITILKGINKSQLNHYRVIVGSNIKIDKEGNENQFLGISRIHEMTSRSDQNLNMIEMLYQRKREYQFMPCIAGKSQDDMKILDKYKIHKRQLIIKFAYELTENDIDAAGLRPEDDPFVPPNQSAATLKKLLRRA